MSDRRSVSDAASSGVSVFSSSTKSPSSESSSSPIGFSSETGCCAIRRISRTSSVDISSSSAISSGRGSRPRRWTSWRSMCTTLFSFSTMCTGMRMVRALSALVREALVLFPFDELDAVVDQVRGEVFDLLLRQLDFLEPFDDLVVGEEAFLLPRIDQLLQFFDVGERDVDGEHLSTTSGYTRLT